MEGLKEVVGAARALGGLELELKLLNASSMEPLLDAHNPRPNEGLLLGRARGPFEPCAPRARTARPLSPPHAAPWAWWECACP